MFFWHQKNEKPRHAENQSTRALLKNCLSLQAISFGRKGAKAHSFGEVMLPSSQTLLARNGAGIF